MWVDGVKLNEWGATEFLAPVLNLTPHVPHPPQPPSHPLPLLLVGGVTLTVTPVVAPVVRPPIRVVLHPLLRVPTPPLYTVPPPPHLHPNVFRCLSTQPRRPSVLGGGAAVTPISYKSCFLPISVNCPCAPWVTPMVWTQLSPERRAKSHVG